MARSTLVAACLLVCVVGAFAAEAKAYPSFAQQLRGEKASVSTAASGHREEEHEGYYPQAPRICLKELSRSNCQGNNDPPLGQVTLAFFTSKVTCCGDEDDYGSDGYGDKKGMFIEQRGMYNAAVGNCRFTNNLLGSPVTVVPGTTFEVGTSSITCDFYDGSEKCDSALCDGSTIIISATIYQTKAYTHKVPSLALPTSNDCKVTNESSKAPPAPPAASNVATASAHYESEYSSSYRNPYYEDYVVMPNPVYDAIATIFSGSVISVTGPKHHEKYLGGKFEMVADFFGDANPASVSDNRCSWIDGPGICVELEKRGKY